MYVYKQSEKPWPVEGITGLWTVGHYDPNGDWEPESDHPTAEAAAERVILLNGGGQLGRIAAALEEILEVHQGLANDGLAVITS